MLVILVIDFLVNVDFKKISFLKLNEIKLLLLFYGYRAENNKFLSEFYENFFGQFSILHSDVVGELVFKGNFKFLKLDC